MSLILEALRKSEAERRRGQAPDLRVENPPAAVLRATAMPAWTGWLLGGALLLAGAWWARGAWTGTDPAPGPTTATVHPTESGARIDLPRGASAAQVPSAATNARAVIDTTPARATDQPPSGTTMAPTAPIPAASAQPAPAPPAVPVPFPAPSQAATATDPAPAEPASMPPAIGTAPPPDAPWRLADLSTSERQQLPPLKISMHLWAREPAERFAIIDGARVGEGDRVGEAVVEEITADGVVLAWLDRRVKLPLR